MEKRMVMAMKEACRALRRRHALEEGAHGPALQALSLHNSLALQDTGFQEKIDRLQQELMQCYHAQAQLSGLLVHELTSAKELRAELLEKQILKKKIEEEILATREIVAHLAADLELKSSALDTAVQEVRTHQMQERDLEKKLQEAESENKTLVDQWMLYKLQEAERINEANEVSVSLREETKVRRLELLARQQVGGVVRHCETGAGHYVDALKVPKVVRHKFQGHEGGCTSLVFESNSEILITGGQDRQVKIWDTTMGSLVSTLHGCLGSVLDLALSSDNRFVLGASSEHKLYLWDIASGRIRHILTGHKDKVSSVDISKGSNTRAVSTAYDRTIKVWDLQTGFIVNTLLCFSNCNSLCLASGGVSVCSGHMDGNLRFWDLRTAKTVSEISAHGQAITSVSLSHSGQTILTSGRDNIHNLFHASTLDVYATFKATGHRLATNWSRSCMSADERYVAAGSVDGSVSLWSTKSNEVETTLKGHQHPVLVCGWSDWGRPLATADKNGSICIWD